MPVDNRTNYEYFSGANVYIKIKNKTVLECAGISYSVSNAKQPVYSYNSVFFDAVLTGRELVQGQLVINYVANNYLYDLINDTASANTSIAFQPMFDIEIKFGNENEGSARNIKLDNCFLIGRGQTIQIDDQVILEEYQFIAQKITKGS